MRTHIVVALAALLVPAVLVCACGEAGLTPGDRAYDWALGDLGVEQAAPNRVTIILHNPESRASSYRVEGRVYRGDGTTVDVLGTWEPWGSFQAEGGGYLVAGWTEGGTAQVSLKFGPVTVRGGVSVIDPDDILGSVEFCYCIPPGEGVRCVKCGEETSCCRPEPMGEIGWRPVPGQQF